MHDPTADISDSSRISLEEKDHLIRSTKKIKNREALEDHEMVTNVDANPALVPSDLPEATMVEGSPPVVEVPTAAPQTKSFKEALAAPPSRDFYFDETTDIIPPDEGDADGDTLMPEDIQRGIPRISLPKNLLLQIRQPWSHSLIVRLLGKSIGYRLLCTKVKQLWALQDDFTAIDLGSNYFLFKFSSQEDCAHVYSGGPWVILDHYLTVRKWEPDFKASEAFETTTAVWVRFPELPIEYFQEQVLYTIAKQLGRPLKIDLTTAMATRGKFARVCIELDLNKPLCPRFLLGKKSYSIEYESIHSLCFHCGRVDHRKELCRHKAANRPSHMSSTPNTSSPGEELAA
ncbi:Uncharacterized protein LOK49_LG05G00852 [Camellia lanceoleosa]|uniref:Uncharacterized protein n=1 Tax=Camellia lanceoleosa TaxID=1840588 RepID=A0ACC0HH27_9ERIC|nr:Uncharacterized protein LOK49_LG05G00852 [Camellia lanceoleosa]